MAEAVKSAAMGAGTATTTSWPNAMSYARSSSTLCRRTSQTNSEVFPRRRSPIELLSQIEQFLSSVDEHCI
jgi:hypothetical protein